MNLLSLSFSIFDNISLILIVFDVFEIKELRESG